MRIAIISDCHMGAKWGTPREQDPFDQAREAIGRALELGADLILLPGDIFDARVPRQEVWARVMRILAAPLGGRRSEVELSSLIDKSAEDVQPAALRGVPMVAVHGNHERRERGFVNPVKALEDAGFLIYLHNNAAILDSPDGRIAVHGMGYVPEQQARNVLKIWNPKPVEGAFNILMLHQAIGEYTYSSAEIPTIDLADIPRGFDLYVCGHIHYRAEARVHGKPLLFPGSTERTQLLPIEAQVPKGFYMLELGDGVKYKFVELATTRDFFYDELVLRDVDIPALKSEVRARLEELLGRPRRNPDKLPLIKLRLRGTLAKGASRGDFDEGELEQEFADRAVVTIGKDELVAPGLEEKIRLVRELRERRLSIDEMAMRLLEESLKELGYSYVLDFRAIYGLLAEGRDEEAYARISEVIEKLVDAECKEEKP